MIGEFALIDLTMPNHIDADEWRKYQWRRASDVYGKGKFKIYDEISPTDIVQGQLGDCYFLSAVSSLAEKPERVKNIFLTKEVNDAGCYALKLYINGEPTIVVIDDYFPWLKKEKDWAFSRSNKDKEIWVLLLEKAWAKIFGTYQRIEGGFAGEALTALTGAPTVVHNHSDFIEDENLE